MEPFVSSFPLSTLTSELKKDFIYWGAGGPSSHLDVGPSDKLWKIEALKHSLAPPFLVYWYFTDGSYQGRFRDALILHLGETFIYLFFYIRNSLNGNSVYEQLNWKDDFYGTLFSEFTIITGSSAVLFGLLAAHAAIFDYDLKW